MITEENVFIYIKNKKAQTYYKNKGFESQIDSYLKFPISQLNLKSHIKIKAKCICDKIVELSYCKYNENINRCGFYSCKQCSNIKRKKTTLENFGVENISQTNKNRERMSIFMKSDEFKNKSKETQIKKYNGHYSKTDEFKNNITNIYLNKTEEQINHINKKRKDTVLSKYNVEHVLLDNIIQEKYKKTMFNKHGVNSPMQSLILREKRRKTFFEKYGTDYATSNNIVKQKILNTKIKRGLITDYSIWSKIDFKKYKRKIYYLTRKKINILKENWDGYDYYDKKYIKNNYSLHFTHGLYPTVDHKISIHSSFILNKTITDVADINNLCITTRSNNSKKNKNNEYN